jgi:hypothetical protein
MMFIPWFEVPNIRDGGTTYIAALAVQLVHDDGALREIVVSGRDKPIQTSISADEVFERMGDAIEGAQNAELEAIRAEIPAPETATVSQRDTSGDSPEWADGWLPG